VRSRHYAGGITGFCFNEAFVSTCYNAGRVTATTYAGGIVGYGSNLNTATGSYNVGRVTATTYAGGIVGFHQTGATAENCYTTQETAIATAEGTVSKAETKTADQFASGEVAYLLGDAFGQTIGTDETPNFTGATVYQVTCGGEGTAYSNTNTPLDHDYVDGICSVCGNVCDHSGNENQLTDCTKGLNCSVCGEVITEAAASHTPGTAVRENEVPATCYAEGSYNEVIYCAVEKCSEKLSSTPKKLPLSEHTYGNLIAAQAEIHTQTQLKAGVAAHYFCDVCDTYFTEGKNETTLEALTGAAPVHSYGSWINTEAHKH
jgi:hypothetical protein